MKKVRNMWKISLEKSGKNKNLTGEENPDEKLKLSVERSKRTIENYKKYLELRSTRYISDEMTSEMLSVFAMHVLLGTADSEEYTRRLCEDTAKKPEGFKGKRLLWVHSLPYWQDSMREIFNFNERCEIVSCDMTFDSLETGDVKNPFDFMAKRTVSCSFNGGWERRSSLCRSFAEKCTPTELYISATGDANRQWVPAFCQRGCLKKAESPLLSLTATAATHATSATDRW